MIEPTSNKDLVTRFTETKYAKKDDVRKDLNTSLIDPIWSAIKIYRSRYFRSTNLLDLSNNPYQVCHSPSLLDNINNLSSKLDKCLYQWMSLDENEKSSLTNLLDKKIVSYIGESHGEKFFDEVVNSIVTKSIENMQFISEPKKIANTYLNTLSTLINSQHKIDIDYIVNLYILLTHNENLVSIYRTFDFNKQSNTVINKENDGVPFNRIEAMMDNLISYINESKMSPLIVASVSFFYFLYIKPFDSFNEEIALLLFKIILANDNKEKIIYNLPLEMILNKKEILEVEFKEIIREDDATYATYKINEIMISVLDDFLKSVEVIKAKALQEEHLNNLKEEVISTGNIASSSAEINNKETEIIPKIIEASNVNKEIAIPKIETQLNEEEAKKLQRYLIEKNPYIKEDQAHFFAHHCTIGCFYTIQMYKAYEKVVYETARTSMDALAKFGYYRKEKIKNKFVYTPIKLEDK